jgi:hypothetical protein
MCDYSLVGIASRPARVGDRIVSTHFAASFTRGFGLVRARDIAVCLAPGTEIAFDADAEVQAEFLHLPPYRTGERISRFRLLNPDEPTLPHDALEFANGEIALVSRLTEGQVATVLQLPVERVLVGRASVSEPSGGPLAALNRS